MKIAFKADELVHSFNIDDLVYKVILAVGINQFLKIMMGVLFDFDIG